MLREYVNCHRKWGEGVDVPEKITGTLCDSCELEYIRTKQLWKHLYPCYGTERAIECGEHECRYMGRCQEMFMKCR